MQLRFAKFIPIAVAVPIPIKSVKVFCGLLDLRSQCQSERVSGKRNIEDRLVERIVAQQSKSFTEIYKRIRFAEWYVLSARKADKLLRDLLFDRVYALKIRGFAQQFRGAELDMHFSLKKDLVALQEFLKILKEEGQTKMASLLERGTL